MNKKKVRLIVGIVIAVFAAWYTSTYWYQFMLIQGDSMLPTYHSYQFVIIDKHNDDYEVGDVIAFKCDGLNAVLVKRIEDKRSDCFYVLGDNRENSIDSRDDRVGLVETETIIGKVIN